MAEMTVVEGGALRIASAPLAPIPQTDSHGRGYVEGRLCQYGGDVLADDIVVADFGSTRIRPTAALYLLEAFEEGQLVWCGCRRLMTVADGIAIDQDGFGEWATLPSLEALGYRVVGAVEKVYRPTA